MEASTVFSCVALFAALGFGYFTVQTIATRFSRKQTATRLGGELSSTKTGWLAWLLRNGAAPFMALSSLLLRNDKVTSFAERARNMLESKGFTTTARSFVSLLCLLAVVSALVGFIATVSLVGSLAFSACTLAVLVSRINTICERRQDAIREAVPDVLRSLSVCFRSGLSLPQTMQQLAIETQGHLGELFARVSHLLSTGSSTHAALGVLRDASSIPELKFVALALDVQHQAGGSMERVLDAARDTVESELDLARSLRVQTAQAKLSARIVSVMPLVLVALFTLISGNFLEPFFASLAGMVLLGIAILMQVAGVCAVRSMLKVEVG